MTHPLVAELKAQTTLPVICAPLFIISNPKMVIAQCQAGLIGAFPALNARPAAQLPEWLETITTTLAQSRKTAKTPIAPFAVNQIIHASNTRLTQDVEACKQYKVPLLITSLSAPEDVVKEAHGWGAKVFHDIISVRHAKKALAAGVDGLVVVCAGAGGHAGTLSPFALVAEIRAFYDGPIILSGAIGTGQAILAAQAIGADFAYMGTRFICTTEAHAVPDYQQAIIDSAAEDVVYTPFFTGVSGNYLKKSIERSGLDPNNLPSVDKSKMDFGKKTESTAEGQPAKAWKDIWGAGQGVGSIHEVLPTADLVRKLQAEYQEAKQALIANMA